MQKQKKPFHHGKARIYRISSRDYFTPSNILSIGQFNYSITFIKYQDSHCHF